MRPSRSVIFLACLSILLVLMPGLGRAQIGGHSILLVASAQMTDPRFQKAVILVTRHGRSPPLGVIINRPLDTPLGTLFPKLPDKEAKRPLYLGGPLAQNMLIFAYRSPSGSTDAIAVAKEVHLGRSGTTLSELLNGQRTHRGLRVFVGYSGWAEGQLENEIRRGDWHVQPVDPGLLFDKDVDLIWPELIRRASQQTVSLPPVSPLPS